MWSLRLRDDGTTYLTFDKDRRRTNTFRGVWEFLGKQGSTATEHCRKVNQQAGYLCCNDDEDSVRILILE